MTRRPNASKTNLTIDVDTVGVFELPKVSALAITAGANPSATVTARLDGSV